jgi:hypothetical protein
MKESKRPTDTGIPDRHVSKETYEGAQETY